ncbi:hypothetical protein ACFXDH_03930 [Streptomyces sp. NPDC059467]|uniref:hypothetical protein n=1 Tax=Streptomyces sp. NPDC059467 TaxID=3346844 RepID=UPI0036C31EFC
MLRTRMRRLPRPLVLRALLITALVVQSVALLAQAAEIDELRVQHVDLQAQGGAVGPSGPPGPSGPAGPAGPQGRNGQDGRNGQEGRNGREGQQGRDGQDGEDGQDGKDAVATPMPAVTVTKFQN